MTAPTIVFLTLLPLQSPLVTWWWLSLVQTGVRRGRLQAWYLTGRFWSPLGLLEWLLSSGQPQEEEEETETAGQQTSQADISRNISWGELWGRSDFSDLQISYRNVLHSCFRATTRAGEDLLEITAGKPGATVQTKLLVIPSYKAIQRKIQTFPPFLTLCIHYLMVWQRRKIYTDICIREINIDKYLHKMFI